VQLTFNRPGSAARARGTERIDKDMSQADASR